MMRVAFPLVGGAAWTGGLNYLTNLLAALREFAANEIESVLFVESEEELAGLGSLAELFDLPPVVVARHVGSSRRWRRPLSRLVFQRDVDLETALRLSGVNIVFQHSEWFGFRFGLPTLTWIPDFQHRYLPDLFGKLAYVKRDIGYSSLARSATRLMLSSDDVRQDCERFYPASVGKCSVVRFAVRTEDWADAESIVELRMRHQLPERFFYLPNQFWKHKNHRLVIDAVARLKSKGRAVNVVCSGNMQDGRDPGFPQSIVEHAHALGLDAEIRFLGMVPRADIAKLMQVSIAVINPSLFEGWSTVVEEAKSLGVPMLLSDLRVHREQAPALGQFFDPHDVDRLALLLDASWIAPPQAVDNDRHNQCRVRNEAARGVYAQAFVAVCRQTLAQASSQRAS